MGLPVRKRYRFPFQAGQLVEVKLGKVFRNQGFDTARIHYIITRVFDTGKYALEVDMCDITGITYEKYQDETEMFCRDSLILNDDRFIHPRRVSTNETHQVGDSVQVAWRLNEETPFGWWDGTVIQKKQEKYLVKYKFISNGFPKMGWYTPDGMRSK